MKVTYEVGDAWTENDFSRDFTNLRNCLFQLHEHLVFFLLRGNPHGFVPYGKEVGDHPCFLTVTFEKEAAEKFEAVMRRYFSLPIRKCPPVLPMPDFDVELAIDFRNGNVETRVFSYGNYCDETLIEFCQSVRRSVKKYKNATLYGGGGI